jgi:PKD repeat protein
MGLMTLGVLLIAAMALGQPAPAPPVTQPVAADRPSFSILLSPGVAPCAIHVNALHFPLHAGTPLTARYDWDFGDPGSRFNTLGGFVAAHLYDYPGRYTITLTVTDEAGRKQSASAKIVIAPDRRHRIYLSPEGVDQNTGTSPDAPIRSLARAAKLLKDECEVLFQAGATYEINSAFQVNHQDIVLDRYGNGADPVLMNVKRGPTISLQKQDDGVVIQHLIFDSPHPVEANAEAPKVGVDAVAARGRNVVVRGCTFLNIDDGINANGLPQGLLVQDCKAPLATGLRAYLVWGQGQDHVYLGNSAANSTREHIVRMSGLDRVLIAYNDFTNLDRRPADKYDYSKGDIEMHRGSYAYIAHNAVSDGPLRAGPLGLGGEPPTSATDWVVMDGNTLKNTCISVNAGSHHIMIRDNVIHLDHAQAIIIQSPDRAGRISGDITIAHNTAINQSDTGAFIKVWGHAEGITLTNNLFVAPHLKPGTNGTAAVNTAEDDLGSFREISHNVWPLPTTFTKGTTDGVCVIGHRGYVNAKAWTAIPQVKDDTFTNVEVDEQSRRIAPPPTAGQSGGTP